MKLSIVTAKQSSLVNIKGLQNSTQMNTKDLSGIAIVKRMKLRNTVGKQITISTGIKFLERSKKLYNL